MVIEASDICNAIRSAWSQSTSADPRHWTAKNPAWGQCAVTALVVQDFLGGSILRYDLSRSQNKKICRVRSHYVNRIDDVLWDLTECQFTRKEQLILWSPITEKSRTELLSNSDTKACYMKLRLNVAETLSGNNEKMFHDVLYRTCLLQALESDCAKGKYGCVILSEGAMIAYAYNRRLPALCDLCEPTCIRLSIPSRTESMIGACGHAEELAIAAAVRSKIDLNKCCLYVAGFRSDGFAYIKDGPEFTCLRCAVQIYMHGVGRVCVPTKSGWEQMTGEQCIQSAKKYALQEKTLPKSS